MPKKRSLLKPSGYDVVIRVTLAIKKINRDIGKAGVKSRQRLIDEKDRLMREMWKACPHESVCHTDAFRTHPKIPSRPLRFCTSCGFDEAGRPFKILRCRRGRTLDRRPDAEFKVKLGETLRRTGINMKGSS